MTPIKRRVAAATAPLLLALSLTACGGSDADDAPESASKEDFCEVYRDEPDESADLESKSVDEQVDYAIDYLRDATDRLKDVGTPEDIPDDAREGYELYLDVIDDLSDDELKDVLTAGDDPFRDAFSDDEQEKADAFDDWANDYCG